MQETWVQSLGWEDPVEKETGTHSSILAWEIPWMEEPGGLQSKRSHKRANHDLVTKQQRHDVSRDQTQHFSKKWTQSLHPQPCWHWAHHLPCRAVLGAVRCGTTSLPPSTQCQEPPQCGKHRCGQTSLVSPWGQDHLLSQASIIRPPTSWHCPVWRDRQLTWEEDQFWQIKKKNVYAQISFSSQN